MYLVRLGLNMNARERAIYIHTELLIVETVLEQCAIRNPINYALSFHRMSKERTPHWLKVKRVEELNQQIQIGMVI